MANFNKSFEKVILAEGGYVNDPVDTGGETYLGISRKHNPNWKGWEIIDKEKRNFTSHKQLSKRLKQNLYLVEYARQVYKEKYWDVLELDDIPNDNVAHQLFDTCVNCGKSIAIELAQRVCYMTPTGKWSEELKHNLINYGKAK